MRTIDDLARELRTLPEGALFAVPALTPAERLTLDEIDPNYLKAVDRLREREIPMTRAAATDLVLTLAAAPAIKAMVRLDEMAAQRTARALQAIEALPTGATLTIRLPKTYAVSPETRS